MLLPLILPENFYDRIHEILETFPFFNVKESGIPFSVMTDISVKAFRMPFLRL